MCTYLVHLLSFLLWKDLLIADGCQESLILPLENSFHCHVPYQTVTKLLALLCTVPNCYKTSCIAMYRTKLLGKCLYSHHTIPLKVPCCALSDHTFRSPCHFLPYHIFGSPCHTLSYYAFGNPRLAIHKLPLENFLHTICSHTEISRSCGRKWNIWSNGSLFHQ